MSKSVAYHGERRSFALQLQIEAVTKCMGVQSLFDPCTSAKAWKQVSNVAGIDLASSECAEQRSTSLDLALRPKIKPTTRHLDRSGVKAEDSALVVLPMLNDERCLIQIDVLEVEREALANPQAAPPGDGDQRPVPDTGSCSWGARPDQSLNVLTREKIGIELAGCLRCSGIT